MTPYYRVVSYSKECAPEMSLDEAQAFAEEKAAAFPGSAFEILRCVGIAQTSKASTFWMDGEEPPEKPRYVDLKPGDTPQLGDEFWDNGHWHRRTKDFESRLTHFHAPHRRPL